MYWDPRRAVDSPIVNSDIPEFLYYKLDLIDANPDVTTPEAKQQIVVDTEVVNSSQLEIKESGL